MGDLVLVHDQHDDRAAFVLRLGERAADRLQRGEQPRHADRKAGRRHRLAAKPRDEPVIAPAAADRAEADRMALVVADIDQELGFEDGASVIFEAADDGAVDAISDLRHNPHACDEPGDLLKLLHAF